MFYIHAQSPIFPVIFVLHVAQNYTQNYTHSIPYADVNYKSSNVELTSKIKCCTGLQEYRRFSAIVKTLERRSAGLPFSGLSLANCHSFSNLGVLRGNTCKT